MVEQSGANKRNFRLVAIDGKKVEKGGTFKGVRPNQVAVKAFNSHCRSLGLKGKCKKTFTIKEITRGSDNKEFTYVGERKKLSKPRVISRGGSEYKVNFETSVRKAK